MADILESLLQLLRFTLSYFLLFHFIPLLVLPFDREKDTSMERWVICLIHSHVFLITIAHLLALSGLYETISLYGAVLVAGLFLLRRRIRAGTVSLGTKQVMTVLDLTDNRGKLLRRLRSRFRAFRTRAILALRRAGAEMLRSPVAWLVIFASWGIVAATRFSHAVGHSYFASSDPYVHLKWAKAMSTNQLYVDGVYPYGFEAVIAVLNKFYLLDPYYIVRYIGPLTAVLLMGTLFFVLYRGYSRDVLLVATVFAVIAGSSWIYGGYVWRQMSALSMEYGILFFFPGIHYLADYFRSGRGRSLLLAAECMILTLFIHPYVAVCTGVAYIITFVLHADQALRSGRFLKLAGIFLAAGAIGVLPLGLGVASGLHFHETSIEFIKDSVTLDSTGARSLAGIWSTYRDQPFMKALLAGAGLLGLLTLAALLLRRWLSRRLREDTDWRMNLVYLFLGLFFFGMYQAGALGIPVFIPEYRLEIFFVIAASIVMALTIRQAVFFVRSVWIRGTAKLAASVLLLLFLFTQPTQALPPGDRFQYEEAVQAYIQIRSHYPHQEWTIVSTIEEYSMVLGYGWHYNMWEFSKEIRERSKAAFSFPTNYVFLFVEKIPLGSRQAVSREDAEAPFPTVAGGRLDDYYRVPEKRRVIEAIAYDWAERYRESHDFMTVFMDTPSMRIYLIRQDGNRPYNLLE
ncbi:hypothetical protein [Gorillibacterium sp. sgz5001074]|uniref:hypothetical protein n=1 Tax=Gorillibacterium sp. sgz5001074 TaxID=3446695 RepID=UPI003F67D762